MHDLEALEHKLDEHALKDETIQEKIFAVLEKIQNNHLFHIEADLGVMKNDIDWIKKKHESEKRGDEYDSRVRDAHTDQREDIRTQTNLDWIMKFFWVFVTAVLGLISAVIILLFKN